MTCRHSAGDPECTSGNAPDDLKRKAKNDYDRWCGGSTWTYEGAPSTYTPPTPDSERFEILDAREIFGGLLIMKVKYPNCSSCAYEGTKIMVFESTSALDALRWKRIDPHFRDPKKAAKSNEAPAPIARFPASDDGWQLALDFAEWYVKRQDGRRAR